MSLPLSEDDLAEPGIIEASMIQRPADVPAAMVLCFFREVIADLVASGAAREVAMLEAAHGLHPVYEVEHEGSRLAVLHPGVGAPLCAGFLEEAIALGGRAFVAVGGAGALLPDLVLGHPVVVDSAVRDEGTSFHYAAPSWVIDAEPSGVAALQAVLAERDIAFLTGRTWTTDAMFRETRSRTQRRVAEGCLTVEMEASALIAVARYRRVAFGQLVYAADSLAGEEWDSRGWHTATQVRTGLFRVAASACVRLAAG